jgi:V8-like Glu-specific endopeptidase
LKRLLGVLATLFAISSCGTFAYADRPNEVDTKTLASVGELYAKGKTVNADKKVEYKDAFICTVSKVGEKKFLTAGHCVIDSSSMLYSVKFNGKSTAVSHYTVGVKERPGTQGNRFVDTEDWAILYTEEDVNVGTLTLDCKAKPYVGEKIYTIGFPYPANKSYFEGYISSQEPLRIVGGGTYWADITAAPGSSGSAIISRDTNQITGILVTGVSSRFGPLLTGVQTVNVAGICG